MELSCRVYCNDDPTGRHGQSMSHSVIAQSRISVDDEFEPLPEIVEDVVDRISFGVIHPCTTAIFVATSSE